MMCKRPRNHRPRAPQGRARPPPRRPHDATPVLQILIAAGMTFYALRFYRGRYGSRLPMILMTLCALWVTASTLVQSVSTYGVSIEGFNPLIVAGVIGAAVAFIFVLLPSSRRYIEAVTEERGEEANRLGRRR